MSLGALASEFSEINASTYTNQCSCNAIVKSYNHNNNNNKRNALVFCTVDSNEENKQFTIFYFLFYCCMNKSIDKRTSTLLNSLRSFSSFFVWLFLYMCCIKQMISKQ